ncbi:MAG: sigma-70 family RNA polymerase sigma factor [Minicystis sp.]
MGEHGSGPRGILTTRREKAITDWLVLAQEAGPDAVRGVFEEVYQRCRPGVEALVRAWRRTEDARDLTQEFFAGLFARGDLSKFDPERGRLRSWLRRAVLNHLAVDWKKRNARKRGSGQAPVSLDAGDTGVRARLEPAHHDTPHRVAERRRALALLSTVLDQLREEYERRGQGVLFEHLKDFLVGDADERQADIAAKLGKSPVAFRQAILRFRERYRALLDAALAEAGGGPDRIEAKRRQLREALESPDGDPA